MIGLEYIVKTFEYEFKDIALLLGIDKANISMWLKGKRNIPQKWVFFLSEYFKLPEYLFQKELDIREQLKISIQYLGNVPFEKSSDDVAELTKQYGQLAGTFNLINSSTPRISEVDLDYAGAEDELHTTKREIAQNYLSLLSRVESFLKNTGLDLSDKESIFRVINKVTELLENAINEDKLYDICKELEFEISEHYEYDDDDDEPAD